MSDAFNASLAGLPGSRPHRENSGARQRIHDSFAEITAAKKRGVTWQAIADLLNEGGFRSTSGDPLTASQVSAAYSAERSSRGLRKRRQMRKPTPPAPNASAPAQPTPPPAALPKPATPPAPAAPRKYPYDFGGPLRYK